MIVNDLIEFLNSLPKKFKDYNIVIRNFSSEEDNTYMYDNPIISGYVDEDNEELCLLDNDNTELYKKLND